VLIVDDNEDAAALLAEGLALFGYDCRVAHAGPEALRIAAEFGPELALLDLGLPGMDGYELSRELRKSPRPPRTIAVTGYGPEDQARSRDAGFVAQLVKPVDLAKLHAAMVRALG
jgi:CheY-like chemotaxis protein